MSVFQDFKRETKVFGNRTVIVQVQRFSFSRKVIRQPAFLCLLYPLFHEPVQIFHKLILLNPSPFSIPAQVLRPGERLDRSEARSVPQGHTSPRQSAEVCSRSPTIEPQSPSPPRPRAI